MYKHTYISTFNVTLFVVTKSKFHTTNLTNASIFIIWVCVLKGTLFSSYPLTHTQKLNHCSDETTTFSACPGSYSAKWEKTIHMSLTRIFLIKE